MKARAKGGTARAKARAKGATAKPRAGARGAMAKPRAAAAKPAKVAAAGTARATTAPGDLVEQLLAVHFFEAWPAEAVARAKALLRSAKGAPSDLVARWPGLALASVAFDLECLDGPGRYSKLLGEFARGSFGILVLSRVRARRRGDKVLLSLVHEGCEQVHEVPWEDGSDWVEEAFFDVLQELFDSLPGPLELHRVANGQAASFVLATGAAYDRAAAAGLLPPRPARARRELSPDAGAPPAARRLLKELDDAGYFEPMPASLSARLRQRVAEAARRGEHPAEGLALVRLPNEELRAPEGARRLFDAVVEVAPELVPAGTVLEVRRKGPALAWTLSAGGASHGDELVQGDHDNPFVIDFLLGDLDRLREELEGPGELRLAWYWQPKAPGAPMRAFVRPTARFEELLVEVPEPPRRGR